MRLIMVFNRLFEHRFVINFIKYRYLLSELVKRDIKIKYRRSVLGIFWSFLQPLLTMIVFTIVFSTLFKGSITHYPVYILSGKLAYDFFSQGSSAAMGSITRNASMINKIYLPKYMYPLSVVTSNFITFMFSMIILISVMIVTHVPFTIYILLAGIPIILSIMFCLGAGLVLATVSVFFRDTIHLYGVFTLLLLYGSAIFYPIRIVPQSLQFLFALNPLYAIITLFRDSFLYGTIFETSQLLYATIWSIAILFIGILLFYRYKDKFVLYI